MAFTYSVQLYSVRTVLEQDFTSVLQKIKLMGYSGVEGAGEFKFSASELKNALFGTGLEIVGYHAPWAYVQDDKLKSTIEYLRILGSKYLIIPSLPAEITKTIDDWKRIA